MTVLLRFLAALFVTIVFGLPMVWMVLISFKSQTDFKSCPLELLFKPTLANYERVFSDVPFFRYLLNSLLVTTGSVFATIALAAPAAYALARKQFIGRGAISVLLILGLTVPIHITLLPLLKTTTWLGISDTLLALGAVYAAFGLALTVFILKNSFEAMPGELLDAAKLDGCSEWQTFFHVALPLARPAIAVAAIYNFVMNYNEFAFALVLLNTQKGYTLPLGIMDLANDMSADIPATAAAISLAVVPVFVVFVFAQRHLIAGLTAGALKG